jgi:hypothetical protein
MLDDSTLEVNARPHRGFLYITSDPSAIRASRIRRNSPLSFSAQGGRIEVGYRLAGGPFRLELVSLRGSTRLLERGNRPAGNYSMALPRDLRSGVYWLRLTQNNGETRLRLPVLR